MHTVHTLHERRVLREIRHSEFEPRYRGPIREYYPVRHAIHALRHESCKHPRLRAALDRLKARMF